jgi:hypothetical protein
MVLKSKQLFCQEMSKKKKKRSYDKNNIYQALNTSRIEIIQT